MGKADYKAIINSMSDAAARECAYRAYPLFKFYSLKREDFRPVDLIEKMYEFSEKSKLNYPGYSLIIALTENCNIKLGSRAERYYERFVSLCRKKGKSIEEVCDVSRIFICLMREVGNPIEDLDYSVSVKDFDFIMYLADANLKKGVDKEGLLKKKKVQLYFDEEYRKFIAANMIIDLCIMLDAEGEFEEETNNG